MSGIQYRAWGKPKQVTLGWNGHGTNVSYNYDAHMEVSRFQVTTQYGITYGAQYQRYADGQVKPMPRIFSIPSLIGLIHMTTKWGRVTQGLTGAEARGSGPPDGPYKQTYGYDAFQ